MSWFSDRFARPPAKDVVDQLREEQLVDDDDVPLTFKSAVRARLDGANLVGADLRHADLRHASFVKANLSGAKFDGADLSWANMSHANLEGVDFGHAQTLEALFQHANLSHADMSHLGGLTPVALRGAKGIQTARLPPGFNPSQPQVAGPVIH